MLMVKEKEVPQSKPKNPGSWIKGDGGTMIQTKGKERLTASDCTYEHSKTKLEVSIRCDPTTYLNGLPEKVLHLDELLAIPGVRILEFKRHDEEEE